MLFYQPQEAMNLCVKAVVVNRCGLDLEVEQISDFSRRIWLARRHASDAQ
jgi:hypothetical protein